MEMCLTGRMMNAREAESANLVARVVPESELLADALSTAATIAAMPPMAAMINKEMVKLAFEANLSTALITERRLFQILAATEDRREGMAAFIEKRARSEEHTSELQSLMRISSAVFCLKKKTTEKQE